MANNIEKASLTVAQLADLFGIDEEEVMRRVRGGRRTSNNKLGDTRGKVLNLMADGKTRHVFAIAEDVGLKIPKVRSLCYALTAERKLVKVDPATFVLALGEPS